MLQAAFDRIRARKSARPQTQMHEGRIIGVSAQMQAGVSGSGLFSDTFRVMTIETREGVKSAVYFEDDHHSIPLNPADCRVAFSLRALPHDDYGAHEAIHELRITGALAPKLVANR